MADPRAVISLDFDHIVLVGKTMVLPVTLFWTKTLVAVKLNWTDQGMVT